MRELQGVGVKVGRVGRGWVRWVRAGMGEREQGGGWMEVWEASRGKVSLMMSSNDCSNL